ncbi:MAG TPA: PKD domain-containing protein [Verrucomicrobiae bacterium]|nr:PKD domain-containing protein [Verrucomicrobiae bacterium]
MVASAQTRIIRIVTYNIEADTDGYTTPRPGLIVPSNSGTYTDGGVLEGIGEEKIAGDPAQPIDILALQETTSNSTTVQPIVNGLNTFYSAHGVAAYGVPAGYAGYAMSTYQATTSGGTSSGGGPNALVYNTNTVQLLASVPVNPPAGKSLGSSSGEYRQVVRYQFAPAGVTPSTTNIFYIYVSHYKASPGTSNEQYRLGEAKIIRSDESTNLPASARVLYVGDYNPDDNSGEPGYQTICSNSAPTGVKQGQGVDPLNISWNAYTSASPNINWSTNTTQTTILYMLSEPASGLLYRDDLQVMTSNVYYDVAGGLQYVPGSYRSFGNNASLPYGSSVTVSTNTALNDLDPGLTNLLKLSATQLEQDLTTASDHLPVVADYTILVGSGTPPSASFTASPTNGLAPLNVAFTDTSTGSPTSWSWTFGDTGTSPLQNPNHTYTTPGSYTVQLIASNAGGSSTNTQVNLITALTPPPVASFTASPTNGLAPLTVTFTDTSSGDVTNSLWDFGDGGTTNVATSSVMYTYVTPGNYSVTEIVSGADGSGTNTQVNLISAWDQFSAWQYQYFQCTGCPQAQPDADPFGKGMSNTNQYLAGLNPTNPASVFRITSVVTDSNNNVLITWSTAGVRTNAVQVSSGDASGDYSNDFQDSSGATTVINITGDTTTNYTDVGGATNSPARYYRIRLVP